MYPLASISRRRFLVWVSAASAAMCGCFTNSRTVDREQSPARAGEWSGALQVTGPVVAGEELVLPPPSLDGPTSLEAALSRRRSVRQYADQPLPWQIIAQLLWSAQGVSDPAGKRTAPSAGALYPLELYVTTGEGLFHYQPPRHAVLVVGREDLRPALHRAALGQSAVLRAAAVFVIAAVYARTEAKYGRERSPRYVHLEAGHAAQNLLLQATALGLGAVPIGAFYDEQVSQSLSLPDDHAPLYLIPVGHPQE